MEEEKKSFLDEETQRIIFDYLFEDITSFSSNTKDVIHERAISVIEKECNNTANQICKHYEKVLVNNGYDSYNVNECNGIHTL